jgi:hypothetical protein
LATTRPKMVPRSCLIFTMMMALGNISYS